jgi:hypothetical protein
MNATCHLIVYLHGKASLTWRAMASPSRKWLAPSVPRSGISFRVTPSSVLEVNYHAQTVVYPLPRLIQGNDRQSSSQSWCTKYLSQRLQCLAINRLVGSVLRL